MKLLWSYLVSYKKILFGALALAAVNQFFSLLDPQIFRLIIDRYATHIGDFSRDEFVRGVVFLLLLSVAVALISRIAKNFQDYFLNVVTQRLGARLYAHGVEHSFSLPYAVFEDQRSGELLQKLQKARADVQALITSSVNVVFFALVGIIFVLAYAFYVHWTIGLAYFLVMPTMGVATFIISRKIKKAQERIVKETAGLAGSTTETLRNVELVKSLGLEEQEIKRLNDLNALILSLELKKVILVRTLSFIQGTMINAIRSAILLMMLWLIFTRAITMGEFFSLWIYSFFIFSPLYELGTVATQYQESRASMEQLQGILSIPPAVKPDHPTTVGTLTHLVFKQVGFHYASIPAPAVTGISFEVRAGQTIAFVGPSGSGKTTVMKLIAGLYTPTEGHILFNDTDSRAIDFDLFRRRIGLVAQETQLFAGTIRENLLFVNPEASDEECIEALRAAAATPIIERGSKGLDTKIGEGGVKISGGERQRLAIARALLRKPDLIIFDEATSSLDSITEKSITKTIQHIETTRSNLTTILVAHRLSTVAHADTIYVLEKGRIEERGTHDSLLKTQGLYSALWRQQVASGEKIESSE